MQRQVIHPQQEIVIAIGSANGIGDLMFAARLYHYIVKQYRNCRVSMVFAKGHIGANDRDMKTLNELLHVPKDVIFDPANFEGKPYSVLIIPPGVGYLSYKINNPEEWGSNADIKQV